MKRTDIAMIILIATLSVVSAFFATSALLGETATETATVKSIESVDASITPPNPVIFNDDAINPAVEVQVGSSDR